VRVVFLGNDAWSVPSLGALDAAGDIEIALVATNPARPAGRGSPLTSTPVAEAARRRGLALAEVASVRREAGLEAVRTATSDLLVVVAYGELLTPDVLTIAPLGAINLHFSLLPAWRGAAPVQHALLAGDPETGVTTMKIDAGLDTGPILEQRAERVLPSDDAGTLGMRLASVGAELLVHTIRSLGELTPRRQDDAAATLAPKLRPSDRALDWSEDAAAIVRRVRALAPDPGARTTFRGSPLNVLAAEPVGGSGEPGEIVSVDDRGVVVAAGRGGVLLRLVAPAGRRHMSASDWANGARFAPRERLRWE
jgi:methionyl-tRNA formyltransferase